MNLASAVRIPSQRLPFKMFKFYSRRFRILLEQHRGFVPATDAARQRLGHMNQYDFRQVFAGERCRVFKRGQRIGREVGGDQNPSYAYVIHISEPLEGDTARCMPPGAPPQTLTILRAIRHRLFVLKTPHCGTQWDARATLGGAAISAVASLDQRLKPVPRTITPPASRAIARWSPLRDPSRGSSRRRVRRSADC